MDRLAAECERRGWDFTVSTAIEIMEPGRENAIRKGRCGRGPAYRYIAYVFAWDGWGRCTPDKNGCSYHSADYWGRSPSEALEKAMRFFDGWLKKNPIEKSISSKEWKERFGGA